MADSKIKTLIQKLDTQSDKAAERIIGQLLKLGRAAIPSLLLAARDLDNPRIRKWSLQALGAIGDARSMKVLIEALKDSRMTVRLHALKGLGRMKSKKAVRAISKLLKDESGGIRVNAIYALLEIGDSSAAGAIQKCLDDDQWYVRQNACLAYGRFAKLQSKKKLMKMAKADPRKAVREAAALALSKLNS